AGRGVETFAQRGSAHVARTREAGAYVVVEGPAQAVLPRIDAAGAGVVGIAIRETRIHFLRERGARDQRHFDFREGFLDGEFALEHRVGRLVRTGEQHVREARVAGEAAG